MVRGASWFLAALTCLASSAAAAEVTGQVAGGGTACPAASCGARAACQDNACCSAKACNADPCYRFYFQNDLLFMNRDLRTDRVAVIRVQDEGDAFPGDPLLSTNAADFDFEPGVRLLLGWRSDERQAFEVSYLGMKEWEGSASVVGDNDLAIPGDLGLVSLDFFAADLIRLDYAAELHSVEFNSVRSYGNVSLLGGFRYLLLDERFNIESTDIDTGTSDYRIRTDNDLYGGQIGARFERLGEQFGWNVTGKAGLFGNAARQRQSVTDFPPGFFLREERTGSGGVAAFVGDVNLSLMFRLTDNWIARAGYNLLWIEGVALAPDQLDFTDTAASGSGVRSDGGVFMHGASLGVEARW